MLRFIFYQDFRPLRLRPGRVLENRDYASFLSGLPRYFTFLDEESIGYYIDSPKGFHSDKFFQAEYTVNMNSEIPGTELRYTLDGSDPDRNSTLYSGSFTIDKNVNLKARNFLPSGKSSPVRSAVIEKVTLREPSENPGSKPGSFSGQQSRATLHPLKSLTKSRFGKAVRSAPVAIPRELQGSDHFALEFAGFFRADEDGIYSFYTTSDDGSRLWIDGEKIVENDGVHGFITAGGQTGLKKGMHSIRVEYFEAQYGEDLKVEMEGPGTERSPFSPEILYH